MRCEDYQARLLEHLAGELDTATANELVRHVEACVACRDAADRVTRLWQALGKLPAPRPPERAAARFAASIARIAESRPPRPSLRAAALLAAVLLGGVAGFAVRGRVGTGVTEAVAPMAYASQFLLLLLEPAAAPPVEPDRQAQLVREYSAWAEQLRDDGRLVGAEKLADDAGLRLRADSARAPNVTEALVPSGYFIIRARDYDDAEQIARSSPHFRYGGSIDIRAIEPT